VRLARLFDDLLETSRLRLENTLLRAERIDLRGLVGEVVEAVWPNAVKKDEQLLARLPTVSDTGRGMSADVLLGIFEPFIRDDDAQGEGLGVGLAIAREWVEVHGERSARRAPGLGAAANSS
jgi:signal transduction histidine kinase